MSTVSSYDVHSPSADDQQQVTETTLVNFISNIRFMCWRGDMETFSHLDSCVTNWASEIQAAFMKRLLLKVKYNNRDIDLVQNSLFNSV